MSILFNFRYCQKNCHCSILLSIFGWGYIHITVCVFMWECCLAPTKKKIKLLISPVLENVMKQILNEIMASEIWNKSAHSKNYYRYDLCYNEKKRKKKKKCQIMCGDSYFAFKWYMEFMKHKTKIIANARNALSVWLCVLIIFQQQQKKAHSLELLCSYHCVNFELPS